MSDDPIRLNLPSASKFDTIVNCPGQQQFANSIPKLDEPADEDAERGSRIHLALQNSNPNDLSEDELEDYLTAQKYEQAIFYQWLQDNNITETDVKQIVIEERMWLHHPQTLAPIVSGQVDKVWLAPPYALCIDYKAGFAIYVPPSNQSWQLRTQANLIWREYDGITKIRVSFCKPKLRPDPGDITDYNLNDLENTEKALLYHLWLAEQSGAPRRAGRWCRYCVCKAFCPDAAAMSLLPSVIARNAIESLPAAERDAQILALVDQLTPADCAKMFEREIIIKKVLEAIKTRLKTMPAEELSALGLQLGKGKTRRKVTNTETAVAELRKLGLTEDAIYQCLTLSLTDLTDVLKREVGMSSKGAPQWWKENLSSVLLETPDAAPIERI